MSIKLVFNSTVVIPQLKEFRDSVKTKPIFRYRISLTVLYLSTEDRMGSVTTHRIIATLLPFPHSLPGKRQHKIKRCLEFLSYTSHKFTNQSKFCCKKGAENIADFKLAEFRSHTPKILIEIFKKGFVSFAFVGVPNNKRLWVPLLYLLNSLFILILFLWENLL